MLDVTDRHFRYFMRLINKDIRLYTEMVVTKALLKGNAERFLQYNSVEHPVALQIGTDSAHEAKACATLAADHGYDEINLNVGCPSDRVKSGNFGACLMAEPEKTAEIVAAMKNQKIEPSVKCRIGITGKESFSDLEKFVSLIRSAGCKRIILHARIAVLKGLSPRENRTIPPLRYDVVYEIKRLFPEMIIEINGGIKTKEMVAEQLLRVDRVMIGRAAEEDPLMFYENDVSDQPHIRLIILEEMLRYAEKEISNGARPRMVYKAMLGLFHAQPGARHFRKLITSPEVERLAVGEILARARVSLRPTT